ncbi:uncharacterized protein LOC62_03G004356 [Vanrija pseudolonga]|uniref:Uncharacterized protein n=1 Tax=Vanrija pseudolonga TaxID=143232 RepID=A0AAF0YBZ6_9TREE|nr:hypothetical protein LOC62_03G004356 [Vanrija pseudolonga]
MSSTTATPRKAGTGKDRWTEEHTKILVRGIINKTMATRKDLYVLEGILGCVDNHGNDRTSKKVVQILETLAAAFNLEKGAVRAGKTTAAASATKRKANGSAAKPAPKKRRGVKVETTEEEWEETEEDDEAEAEFTE